MLDTKKNLIPGLYLVSTPIGNLGDITHRAEEVLFSADIIACEDTRVTGKLLDLLGIRGKNFLSYHEHNADIIRPKVISFILSGKSVALVSDAGTPLISDPGYRLVRDCFDQGCYVTSCPGASAVLTALQLSGLPTDKFFFYGFLPSKQAAKEKELIKLKGISASIIFYESPHRLLDTLRSIFEVFGNCSGAVIRELTKHFEESIRFNILDLIKYYQDRGEVKGEVVIVINPLEEVSSFEREEEAKNLLYKLLDFLSLKDATAIVSEQYKINKKLLYEEALKIKDAKANR